MMASAMTIAMVIFGIIFIIAPGQVLNIIHWIIACLLLAAGAYLLCFRGVFGSIILILLGLIVAFHPGVMDVIPIILGIYVVISSSAKLRGVMSLKSTSPTAYTVAMVTSVISLVCGVLMIIHPGIANTSFMVIVGIAMVIYGLSDFIDMVILQKHLNAFAKGFSAKSKSSDTKKKEGVKVDDIKEAEVVKKK